MVRVTSVRWQRNTKRQIQLLVVVTSINATMNHRISFTQISFPLSLFMAQSTDLNTVAKSPKNNEKIFFPLERYGCSVGPLNLLDSTHNLARAFWPSREKRHKGKRKRGWELRGKKNWRNLLKATNRANILRSHDNDPTKGLSVWMTLLVFGQVPPRFYAKQLAGAKNYNHNHNYYYLKKKKGEKKENLFSRFKQTNKQQ